MSSPFVGSAVQIGDTLESLDAQKAHALEAEQLLRTFADLNNGIDRLEKLFADPDRMEEVLRACAMRADVAPTLVRTQTERAADASVDGDGGRVRRHCALVSRLDSASARSSGPQLRRQCLCRMRHSARGVELVARAADSFEVRLTPDRRATAPLIASRRTRC